MSNRRDKPEDAFYKRTDVQPVEVDLVAHARYTLKQILQKIETIFALREFLPENIAVPALGTASASHR